MLRAIAPAVSRGIHYFVLFSILRGRVGRDLVEGGLDTGAADMSRLYRI